MIAKQRAFPMYENALWLYEIERHLRFTHTMTSRIATVTSTLKVNSLFLILQHDSLVELCCKGTLLRIGEQTAF